MAISEYFIKWNWTRNWTFRKVDPGPLEKLDPMPKFTKSVKNSFLTNLSLLVSNMTIAIRISVEKHSKRAFLDPNVVGVFRY